MASHDGNGKDASSSSPNPAQPSPRRAPVDPVRERAEAQFQAWLDQVGAEEIAIDVSRRNLLGQLKPLTRIGPPMPGQGIRQWVTHLFGGGRFLCNVYSGEAKLGTLQFDVLDVPAKQPPPGGWARLADLDFEAQIPDAATAPVVAPNPFAANPFAAMPWWGDPEKVLGFVTKLTERQASHDEALVRAVMQARGPAVVEPDPDEEEDFLELATKRFRKVMADRMMGELGALGRGARRVIDVESDDDDEDSDDGGGAGGEDSEWGWLRDSVGRPVAEAIGEEFAQKIRERRGGGEPETNAQGERMYTEAEAREIYRRRRAAAQAAAAAAEKAEREAAAAGEEPPEIIKPPAAVDLSHERERRRKKKNRPGANNRRT